MRLLSLIFSILVIALPTASVAASEVTKSQLLAEISAGNAVAMMRHALAPGTGDPANFNVNDCSTQRNLSGEGREQAQQIGETFKAAGISEARIMTSAWCRCRDTADLLAMGEVEVLPALNSFFQNRDQRDPQTEVLKEWLEAYEGNLPVVLVTHQVNITALTGVFPRSGETVVFRLAGGEVEVLGSF